MASSSLCTWIVFLAWLAPAMAAGTDTVELYRALFTSSLLLVVVFVVVYWYLKLHLIFPSDTAIAMALGIGVGAIARACDSYEYTSYSALIFNEPFFTSLILPTVMINFGYNTVWRMFRLNKVAITAYSLLSGVLNFSIFGACIYSIQKFAQPHGWPQFNNDVQILWMSLFLATLITAVEPDALLAFMFEKYKMDEESPQPVLYPLLKWEMILTTSIMFDSAEVLVGIGGITFDSPGDLLWRWFWVIVVSAILGLIAGLIFGVFAALLFKYCDMRDATFVYHELGLLLIVPYFCYWTCQFVSFVQSEIRVAAPLSAVVCAVVMGNLVWKNLSEGARYHFQIVIGGLGHLAEMYNYAILGATLFFVIDVNTWDWGYIFAILGLKYGSRLFTIPLPALVAKTIGFGSPVRYSINYPEYARSKITPQEKDQATRMFIVHDEGAKGYLTVDELSSLLLSLGHAVKRTEVLGLMTVVDDDALDKLGLYEFHELVERAGLLRPGASLRTKPAWGVRTGLCCWLGGVQGHIAFGAAILAQSSGVYLLAGSGGLASILPVAWMLVAIGVLFQGALSPLALKLFGVVPAAHYHQHNEHKYYNRGGLKGFLTHPTKLMTRRTYMREASKALHDTDEVLLSKAQAKEKKELLELDAKSRNGGGTFAPGAPLTGGYPLYSPAMPFGGPTFVTAPYASPSMTPVMAPVMSQPYW